MAISLLNLTLRAGNTPLPKLDEKELAAKFENLENLENYVSQNEGITLSKMMVNDQELVNAANIDVLTAASHQNPHSKQMPSFKEKPWLYIGAGALIAVIVVVFVLTGGEGYSSR